MLTQQQPAKVVDLVALDLNLQAILEPRGSSDGGASLAALLEGGSHRARVQAIGLQVPDHGHLVKQKTDGGHRPHALPPETFQGLCSLLTLRSPSPQPYLSIQIINFCASKLKFSFYPIQYRHTSEILRVQFQTHHDKANITVKWVKWTVWFPRGHESYILMQIKLQWRTTSHQSECHH